MRRVLRAGSSATAPAAGWRRNSVLALGLVGALVAGGCGGADREATGREQSAAVPVADAPGPSGAPEAGLPVDAAAPGSTSETTLAESATASPGAAPAIPRGNPSSATVAKPGSGGSGTAPAQTEAKTGTTPVGGGSSPNQQGTVTPGPNAGVPAAPGGGDTLTASDVGVTPRTIKFCNVSSVTGPLPILGYPAFTAQAFLRWQNDKGGLNGRKFDYAFYDDSLDGSKAKEAAERCVSSDKAFAFYGNGATFTQSVMNTVADPLKMPTVGSSGWGPGDVSSEYVFHTGLRTNNAGHIMAQMAESFFKPQKPGMVSTDIDLSQQCASEPRRVYKKLGRPIVAETKPTLTDPDYTPYILQLRQAGADLAFFCIDSASLLRFYRAAQRQNYKIQVVAVHANYDYTFSENVGDFANGLVVEAGPFPPVEGTNARAREFVDVFLKYQPDNRKMISSNGAIAWSGGFVLMEALQRAGLNPTRASLYEALKSITNFDWGFGPKYTAEANKGWTNYDGFKVARDPVQWGYAVELQNGKYVPKGDAIIMDKNL